MKKFLYITLILVFFSSPVIAKYATIEAGPKVLSASFLGGPLLGGQLYGTLTYGIGFSLWFNRESHPDYIEFDDEPFDWWEYKGDYVASNSFEIYLRSTYPVSEIILLDLGVGAVAIEKVQIWYSTATGWYWGYKYGETQFSYLATINIGKKGRYVCLGYHAPYGFTLGVKWRY